MKNIFYLILIAILLNISMTRTALAQGGGATGIGGGGDYCEPRIQEIRDDIMKWIQDGGPKSFKDIPISVEEYSSRMTEFLKIEKEPNGALRPATNIECTQDRIFVDGIEKTCSAEMPRFFGSPKIRCNTNAFMSKTITEDEQYRLIHHEYAVLAGLEVSAKSQSSYIYSNQLSAMLEKTTIKKLSIKTKSPSSPHTVDQRVLNAIMSKLKTMKWSCRRSFNISEDVSKWIPGASYYISVTYYNEVLSDNIRYFGYNSDAGGGGALFSSDSRLPGIDVSLSEDMLIVRAYQRKYKENQWKWNQWDPEVLSNPQEDDTLDETKIKLSKDGTNIIYASHHYFKYGNIGTIYSPIIGVKYPTYKDECGTKDAR